MINYFVFPSIELGALDVLEGLLYVPNPFCVLCSLLVTYVFTDLFSFITHEELHQSEDEGNKAVQTHVLKCKVY